MAAFWGSTHARPSRLSPSLLSRCSCCTATCVDLCLAASMANATLASFVTRRLAMSTFAR
eukprot:249246-Chlamydomonas_euryale.AAC.1